ncbi:uncharacterized protein LOC129589687 [Paramacrobiotus metropolitanus]|uniref:uncharacterized protein LOC129589687 n=1 Tax=Paramacrobiotus metropolitanus TaxID=2943436 RepID=UPI0024465289|nr:uncharacterized protein LOC129589687 [Paramacrobiotus metropolitanus]
MERHFLPRIGRYPLVAGVYDRFLVDILGGDAVYRGYVCGIDNNDHCMVRVGSMQRLQRIPIDQLRLVDPEESKLIHPNTLPEEIELLVSVEENQPESWQPVVLLVDGTLMENLSLVNVDVCVFGDFVKRYLVLHSTEIGMAFSCLRPRGYLGAPVTPQSFRQVTIPIVQLMFYSHAERRSYKFSDNTEHTLERIREFPSFRSRFLRNTRNIMFLGVSEDKVELLCRRGYKLEADEGLVFSVSGEWYKRLFAPGSDIIIPCRRALEEMLTIITFQHDLNELDETRFGDLYVELCLMVFGYLDVFDQHCLRR